MPGNNESMTKQIFDRFNQFISFLDVILQEFLDEATDPWGVRVERVEM